MLWVMQCNDMALYLFIADGNSATSVCVQSLEAFSQGAKHYTTLDEVIKLHRLLVAAVKHPCT